MESEKDKCHCQTNISCEEICKCDCKGKYCLTVNATAT